MQTYKAPIKDYSFLINDFLNHSSFKDILKNSDIEKEDILIVTRWQAKLN